MNSLFERWLDRVRRHGLETALKRFYSVYAGVVVSTEDPKGIGRIKVRAPDISQVPELSAYACPMLPFAGTGYGIFFQPKVGDFVNLMFEHGKIDKPVYFGGFWAAPGEVSQMPDDVPVKTNPTSTRLIKTPIGHGILFEDATANDKRLELFTGSSITAKLHRLVMSDTNKQILVTTADGHEFDMNDASKLISLKSVEGFELLLSDATDRAALLTPSGHILSLSDANQQITITSAAGNSFLLSDMSNSAVLSTVGTRKVSISDTASSIEIFDPAAGQVILNATGISMISLATINMIAATTASLIATGAVTIAGAGMNIQSLGGSPAEQLATGNDSGTSIGVTNKKFIGAAFFTFAGAVTLAVAGAATLTIAGVLLINVATLLLGGAAAKKLVNEDFLLIYNTHTHATAAPGPPSLPTALGVVDVHTTIKVKAE